MRDRVFDEAGIVRGKLRKLSTNHSEFKFRKTKNNPKLIIRNATTIINFQHYFNWKAHDKVRLINLQSFIQCFTEKRYLLFDIIELKNGERSSGHFTCCNLILMVASVRLADTDARSRWWRNFHTIKLNEGIKHHIAASFSLTWLHKK